MPFVTFACVMIPKAVYDQLGGLDEAYRNGYEDCDFCLRARAAGRRVTYTPASLIYHYGQSTPGRKDTDDANWKLFASRWGDKIERNFAAISKADREYNERRYRGAPSRAGGPGIHFAVDFSEGSAFTWATAELISALAARGEAVSVTPVFSLNNGIEPAGRKLIKRLMKERPRRTFHVKWSHFWPSCMNQPMFGEVNAEFYCTNYRFRREDRRLDLWTRQVLVSDNRLLPISGFNRDALMDAGVAPERCAVVPLGYAPETVRLFPDGKPAGQGGDLRLLVVTNSHDLERYGTDVLVNALGKVFGPGDPVEVHLKDYGVSSGSTALEDWIKTQKQFPRVVWHREFLSKEDLIRLYAQMDVLVAPFRGEGFGMKILDGMALGLPTLMPAFGGPAEFAPEGTFLPVKHREAPVGDCYDRRNAYLPDGVYWAEPDTEDLAAQLRSLPGRREELTAIGRKAREHVLSRFSWDEVAARFLRALRGWESNRLVEVAPRRRPSVLPLSVIIPTKDREPILAKTLAAYAKQTVPADRYEILLVNDHGRMDKVKESSASAGGGLNVRILDNPGQGGPAAARNLAIGEARGEIVFITGDDIIPDPTLLEHHLAAHEAFPTDEKAFVGRTLWHPELTVTPFMDYINAEGGHQFNYKDARHRQSVPFDRFYTSNVSLKRAFLAEEETLFSTAFRYAAYEDVELAYRLHLRGMDLRYDAKAVGYHHHDMDPRSFINRQLKVGRMLALMALRQPSFVPSEHTVFLKALEFVWAYPALKEAVASLPAAGEGLPDLVEALVRAYEELGIVGAGMRQAADRPLVEGDARVFREWTAKGEQVAWEAVNELVLRLGMADEWAVTDEQRRWARSWVMLMALPSVLKKNRGDLDYLFYKQRGILALRLPGFMFLLALLQRVRSLPVAGVAIRGLERTRLAMALRNRLFK